MSDSKTDITFDEFDDLGNEHQNEIEIYGVIERAVSRRSFLSGTAAASAAALAAGTGMMQPAMAMGASRFGFDAVAANSLDTITVPKGYAWQVVMKWGEPLWSGAAEFDEATRGTGESQEKAFGDNTDGMSIFAYQGKTILAVNNEYVNRSIFYGNRDSKLPETIDDVRKGKAGHGVSVCELSRIEGQWALVKDSVFNRRITADTPMQITGPAAGHDLLKTEADPTGTKSLGTWNNCANGRTPWGTYLTCEENFNGYFSASDEGFEIPDALKRYGINSADWGYKWAMGDERFDVSKHPNEPNRAGYVVEIDPLNPNSTPKKRSALGRFKHENAEVVVNIDGRIVVYLGDDERGEFLYRFISDGVYMEGGDNSNLLEKGSLYVAKFHDDGKGEWLALTPESTGMASQAEICIHTRQAASKVGATTMDRPEWVSAHPNKAEVYCCLTNNKNRGKKPNKGGDATPVGGPNPREANKYGQIVRWRPQDGDHSTSTFGWDLFVVAGNPQVHSDGRKGSSNVTADNMFNSPDGIAFDRNGILWIQTDGKYSNEGDFAGMGNNQMLAADPETGEIRRFMVGPKECEVTGLTWSPDRRTMFIGIQHPGEKGNSHFPGGGSSVPRSSIVAISRIDGGLIG